jgi:very-short-patch-repair endonuclease
MRDKRRPLQREEGRHLRLAQLAGRQHGVVSARQLGRLGYSRHAISRAAAQGRLVRIHRGVYAVGHANLTALGSHLAAVMACRPNAFLSHGSAAWLWGLLRRPGPIHVTSTTRRHRKDTLRVHHAALNEEDRAASEGIPVTSVARTLLDMAATLPPRRLDGLLERAEELRLLDIRAVESVLSRAATHPGLLSLRRAARLYRPEPRFTRSGMERCFLDLVRDSGLPLPATNCFVAGFEIDAYWERERFAVELDTYEFHGSPAAFERDRLRQEDLALAGIEMIRVTGHRLDTEPQRVVERLAKHLERRRSGR